MVKFCSQLGNIIRGTKSFYSNESGQSLAEYGLILALAVLVAIAALEFLGTSVKEKLYNDIVNSYPS